MEQIALNWLATLLTVAIFYSLMFSILWIETDHSMHTVEQRPHCVKPIINGRLFITWPNFVISWCLFGGKVCHTLELGHGASSKYFWQIGKVYIQTCSYHVTLVFQSDPLNRIVIHADSVVWSVHCTLHVQTTFDIFSWITVFTMY